MKATGEPIDSTLFNFMQSTMEIMIYVNDATKVGIYPMVIKAKFEN